MSWGFRACLFVVTFGTVVGAYFLFEDWLNVKSGIWLLVGVLILAVLLEEAIHLAIKKRIRKRIFEELAKYRSALIEVGVDEELLTATMEEGILGIAIEEKIEG